MSTGKLGTLLLFGLLAAGVLLYGCLQQQTTPTSVSKQAQAADADIAGLQAEMTAIGNDLASIDQAQFNSSIG